ncbi:MAG TPA: hypothetical protein VGF76_25695, partial [Polyangiaceae bacterium]
RESAFDSGVDFLLHHEACFACFIGLPARPKQTLGTSGYGQRSIGAGLRVGIRDDERSFGETS